ncbi:MAG TPA: outer membrane beta-barrel protein [Burkholderiales bacterium]
MKCRRFLAAAALILFSLPASAQLYVTAGMHSVQPKFGGDFDFGVPRRSDTKDTGYQANLGYRFSTNWAAEIGVADLGDYSFEHFTSPSITERLEVQGVKVAVVGMFPGTGRFNVIGKLGIARTTVDWEGQIGATVLTADHKRNSLLAGFGVQYNVTDRIGVRAEYENWGEAGNEADTGRLKISTWNVLAVFSF